MSRKSSLYALMGAFLILLIVLGNQRLAAQSGDLIPKPVSLDAPVAVQTAATPCVAGMAGSFSCDNVDLLAHMPIATIGGGTGNNDIWGWTDSLDGKEYALVGRRDGTSFVDLGDPENPIYLGNLPSHNGVESTWRDIKVYNNYAYIVADGNSGHGMQIFDLTQLRNVVSPPVTFVNTAHYSGFGSKHNIVINEETGFGYAVGGSTCSGGLDMINLQNPTTPTFAGCFSGDGYTHDAQCIIYNGPDVAYQGHEICFNSNTDTLTIVDVTDKANPNQLSRTSYAGVGYAHQGWITEDHAYFLLDDELDEQNFGHNTKTYIWDIRDLDSPINFSNYTSSNTSSDHNLYIDGDFAYASNYASGLRILDISDIANGNLTEVAYFDTYPANDNASFNGQWSNYPFFASGIILANDRTNGLFILQAQLWDVKLSPDKADSADAGQIVTYTLGITNTGTVSDTYTMSLGSTNWTTTVSTNTVFLEAGEGIIFEAWVEVSAGASNGGMDTAVITAASQTETNVYDTVTLQTTAVVPYDVSTSPNTVLKALPGTTVTHTVTITNSGNLNDVYDLFVDGTWTSNLSPDNLTLATNQSGQAWVTIDVPVDAVLGEMDTAVFTATSQTDPNITATVQLTTIAGADYYAALWTADPDQTGLVGSIVTYTLWLTNDGNLADTYDITLTGTWTTTSTVVSITLAANTNTEIPVSVWIPNDALNGESDVALVTAVSANTTNSLQLTTTADTGLSTIFLPFVTRSNE
jgi:choice-of-anchor B domain-containing protein